MKLKAIFIVLFMSLFSIGNIMAESEFYKQFKNNYGLVDRDILSTETEVIEVKDFVYKKDVATFTFNEGTFYLLRYIDEQPTTAFFVGKGKAHISIPSPVEQEALKVIISDTVIDEEFESCLIRMADDFDLMLKENFESEMQTLKWKPYNMAKKEQGGVFFKPVIFHHYDYYFQLLRSNYERAPDGFFWVDFNRYVFNFDPNRPEQVIIGYELQGGDQLITECAQFQRREKNLYDNYRMSDITYESTILEKSGTLEVAGLDARDIRQAEVNLKLLINTDSLRFITMFLDRHFKIDSLYFNDEPVDFHRRGDFAFFGIILPEYHHKNDTLSFTVWYEGNNFDQPFPYVDNPQACVHSFTFIQPKGYNYFMPGMSELSQAGKKRQFTVTPANKYRSFYFRGYAAGLDTLPVTSDIGLSLNILKWNVMNKKYSNCFIPDEMYETTCLDAFNFMCGQFGSPPGTFEVYVSPAGNLTMPGLMEAPQIACVTSGPMEAYGGFKTVAGLAAAKQWFGSLLQPASPREEWLVKALPEYAGLLYLEKSLGGAFYANLYNRRDSVSVFKDIFKKMPLAAGKSSYSTIQANKGLWVLHMLRFMMHDLENHSDKKFLKLLREIQIYFNNKKFTNEDFIKLCEKHYGQSLASFFDYWLYYGGFPEFDVNYTISQKDDGYYIDTEVKARGVNDAFSMPVILSVIDEFDNSIYLRQTIIGTETKFQIGPFANKPDKMVFNEFYSIMSYDNVNKK